MINDQTIRFVFLYLSEILLFLTFCAICWYTWETRNLALTTNKSTRLIAYNNLLLYYSERHAHLCKAESVASNEAKPLLAIQINNYYNKIKKIEEEIEQEYITE